MHHRGPRLAIGLALLLIVSSAATLGTAPATAAADFPAYDSRYHTYAEMVAEIQATRDAHPDIVALSSIGKS
jgi:predicted secreted protein